MITFKLLLKDDEISSAEAKYNNISKFIREHDKIGDEAVYLVHSRYYSSGASIEYYVFEDNLGNTDKMHELLGEALVGINIGLKNIWRELSKD